ncbi:orotidine-5'-phosphate decarboxylase [candidate division KSB1 bacterium]|nr:MAG: orotidine-5'-phosphate decarboxylase [candidate division KSB1 bacterium]
MNFGERLDEVIAKQGSLLSIGLDVDVEKIPPFLNDFESPLLEFNKSIINATAELVCAYKLNLAFYEAYGIQGWRVLRKTLELIPPPVLKIADGKRADIGNSSRKYAHALFNELDFDAVTVNPYLGFDAIEPFLADSLKGVFVLCLTSNPGAADFQFLKVNQKFLFEIVAEKVVQWNLNGNCGLVVGATQAEQISRIRAIAPNLPLLIPGIGAQGGDLKTAISYGLAQNNGRIIINSGRSILYTSQQLDFAQQAYQQAVKLRDEINHIRSKVITKGKKKN